MSRKSDETPAAEKMRDDRVVWQWVRTDRLSDKAGMFDDGSKDSC